MQTEHDVLTDHNELICSTNIERIVTGRNTALVQTEQLIHQLHVISQLTSDIGGGIAEDWAIDMGHRYSCRLLKQPDKAMNAIIRSIDCNIWRNLMQQSGMLALMDAEARGQWHKNLEEEELPVISEENIFATFEQLHQQKTEVFERGIINVFKKLSWDYKTNNPCCFGKKIILNGIVSYNRWGYSLNWGWRRDQLVDLERMLCLLDNRAIPDNRNDIAVRLMEHIRDSPKLQIYEDDLFRIHYFQKGSGHVTFKRLDLVDRMNDIVAKHYPGMLAI